jgi:hypothetical protein
MAQIQSNIIKIANPPLYEKKRTYLSSDIAAGVTTLPVLSTIGFTVGGTTDYFVFVGNYGEEKAEIVTVDTTTPETSTSFTVGATKYAHEGSTPITLIPFNQINIYGLTATGGTKNPIKTIDIDCTQQFTEYSYNGTDYNFFVTSYYDSENTNESGYSDEYSSTSFGHNSLQRIIKAGLRRGQVKIDDNPNSELNWDTAIEIIQDGLDEILARKRKWSFLHVVDSTSTDTVSGTQYVSIPTDCKDIEFIKVNGQKINWVSKNDFNKFTDYTTAPSGQPTCYTIKSNKIYLYPTPSSAQDVTFEYYQNPVSVNTLSGTVPEPFIVPLVYYCGSVFSGLKANSKKSDELYSKFQTLLEQQAIEYSGPQQSGTAEYVESTSIYGPDNETDELILE